jgi:hypothetical protein
MCEGKNFLTTHFWAVLSHIIAILMADFSEQFASDTDKLQVEIHKRFVNKASDWTIRKKEPPIQLLRLFDLLIVQSEALFTNLW